MRRRFYDDDDYDDYPRRTRGRYYPETTDPFAEMERMEDLFERQEARLKKRREDWLHQHKEKEHKEKEKQKKEGLSKNQIFFIMLGMSIPVGFITSLTTLLMVAKLFR